MIYHKEYSLIRSKLNKLIYKRKKDLWSTYIESINKIPIHEKLKIIGSFRRNKIGSKNFNGPDINDFRSHFEKSFNELLILNNKNLLLF